MLEPQAPAFPMPSDLRDVFLEIFKNNKYLVVDFNKVDGEKRVMDCSTHPEVLPEYLFESKSVIKRKQAMGVLTVWDLNKKDWRSFKVENVNMITAKNNETGEESVKYIKG
jgi:hypothetical protein